MGADEFKKQCEFERTLKKGDRCQAYWTNSYRYFQTEVEVEAINKASYRVRVVNTVDGYPAGWKLNIPNALNYQRFTWNNRLGPLEEVKA
jgi:hypothetical protein